MRRWKIPQLNEVPGELAKLEQALIDRDRAKYRGLVRVLKKLAHLLSMGERTALSSLMAEGEKRGY